MTIANASSNEYGKITGGKAGDQTGKEWRVRPWYPGGWDVVLRHSDPKVSEAIASMGEDSANNNKNGYDQGNDRHTFWAQLKAAGFDPKKIKKACEADCSSGVAAIVKAVGYLLGIAKLKALDYTSYTGNLRSRLKAAGFTALTDSKYLTSDAYLLRGDILLNDVAGGHVCINLTNGSKSGKTTASSTGVTKVKIELNILKNGSTGDQVKTLQRLLNALGYNSGKADGIFGANTLSAVRKFQRCMDLDVDGVVGAKTWGALLGV